MLQHKLLPSHWLPTHAADHRHQRDPNHLTMLAPRPNAKTVFFLKNANSIRSVLSGSLNYSIFRLNPSPQYCRVACPCRHGITVVFVPIQVVLP